MNILLKTGIMILVVALGFYSLQSKCSGKPGNINNAGIKLILTSVEFSNDNVVRKDNGNPYSGSDWEPHKRQPVSYKSGEKATIQASWSVNHAGLDVSDWRIRGNLTSGNTLFSPIGGNDTTVEKKDKTIILNATTAGVPFATEMVQYHANFRVEWEFSFDKGITWKNCATGSSDNLMYITYGEPQAIMYHTPLHIGCLNASGFRDPDLIVSEIWNEFSDRKVKTVNSITGEFQGDDLRYFGSKKPRVTMEELLEHGDAWCGAWADFFTKINALQNITVEHIEIIPKDGHGSAIVTKNLVFEEFPDHPGEFPYSWGPSQVTFAGDYPAQGGVPILHSFNDHGLNRHKGVLYDPSFGGDAYPSLHAWEEDRLGGYLNNDKSRIKKNDEGAIEVIVNIEN